MVRFLWTKTKKVIHILANADFNTSVLGGSRCLECPERKFNCINNFVVDLQIDIGGHKLVKKERKIQIRIYTVIYS